jgi:glycosyltransferase involved in cell wall biosynthesis
VRKLSRPGSVEIVGEVEDTHPWLEAADVVLVPSDDPEPFGLVAIEAFARARPVVGSSGGGLAEIIEHGRTGWLFPPGDAGALAQVLLALTRDQAEQAATAARVAYEENFTTARFALDWISAVGLSG